jgi:FtsH-binding integral membrane protein
MQFSFRQIADHQSEGKFHIAKSTKYRTTQITTRGPFIARVYRHLLAAVLIVVVLEILMFQSGLAQPISEKMLKIPWLLILAGLNLIGWLARRVVYRAKSKFAQYAAFAGYILAKTTILMPLLYLANSHVPGVLTSAAQFTLVGFLALTWIAFSTRKDFTFLRAGLRWGGFIAIALIVLAIAFHFQLGVWFNISVIALAGTAILYDTSRIIHRYRDDRYVAAATALFASVALMFWHSLRLFQRLARQR